MAAASLATATSSVSSSLITSTSEITAFGHLTELKGRRGLLRGVLCGGGKRKKRKRVDWCGSGVRGGERKDAAKAGRLEP